MRRFLISSAAVLAFCAVAPAVMAQTAAPAAAVSQAQSGLSAPLSNGAPVMTLRVFSIEGSKTKRGETTPSAARAFSVVATCPM